MTGGLTGQMSLLSAPTHAPRPGQLRLLTWNVQHANRERSHHQAAWLAASDADVLVLTEVAARSHDLSQALGEQGFTTHHTAGGTDYLTMIASRVGPITSVPAATTTVMPHRCHTVLITCDPGPRIAITGLYVPSRGPKDQRNIAKRQFQDAVAALLPALAHSTGASGPIIIAGDLNVIEPDHQPPHTVYGAWEYDFYRAFAATGYSDAFRQKHPSRAEHSWFGRRSGLGYRFDHIFTNAPNLVADCDYHHEPRLEGLSDHAAMTLTLNTHASASNRTTPPDRLIPPAPTHRPALGPSGAPG